MMIVRAAPVPPAAPAAPRVVVPAVKLSPIFNDGNDLQSGGLPQIMITEIGTPVVEQRKRQALE